MQFCRYLPLLKMHGIKISIENSPRLIELHINSSLSNVSDALALKTVVKKRYCNRKRFYFEIASPDESGFDKYQSKE